MSHRYLAFDIETAKDVPGDDFNWRPHRPLGISCAATLASDATEPTLWYSKTVAGQPDKQLTQPDAIALVQYLEKMSAAGYRVLTWNGLAFDFDILAEESAAPAACRELARGHIDMMFHVVCALGYPVGLNNAAKGLGLPGKPAGMSGLLAPQLWAQGRHAEVLEYVAQDVRTTLQVAQTCDQRRRFEWLTRKGTTSRMPLPHGWLTVTESLRLPEPDTSWMSTPLRRTEFTAWL